MDVGLREPSAEIREQRQAGPRIEENFRTSLLTLSIALIVITTMVPTALRRPSLVFLDTHVEPSDVVLNVLLYMPLGLALARRAFAGSLAFGALLSITAETLQFGYVHREPSPIDVTMNVLGTALGWALSAALFRIFRWRFEAVTVPRWLAKMGLPLAALGILSLVVHRTRSDFSNWTPNNHLAVGNEFHDGRPWHGTISQIEIYDRALDGVALGRASELNGIEPVFAWNNPSGVLPPYRTPLLTGEAENTFFQRLKTSGHMTLLVRMRAANVTQKGPARIVTYSVNSWERNFTLGQIGSALVFRLRTPSTTINGTPPELITGPVLKAGRETLVAAVYDGSVSRLYVERVPVGQLNLAARRPQFTRTMLRIAPNFFPIHDFETTIGEYGIGMLACLGWFAITGIPGRRYDRLRSAVWTGSVAGLLLAFLGTSILLLGFRLLLLSIAGALTMAAALECSPDARVR